MHLNVARIQAEFPLLSREVNGHRLVYLDSAASAQKPQVVIDAESEFYKNGYAAVHRGIHTLSAEATTQMETIRAQVAHFLNAAHSEEIVFVKGATEAINLVANSWGNSQIHPGDNIIITEMEHHSNIVPWQMLAKRMSAELRFIPLTVSGTLDTTQLSLLMDCRTRLLAVTHVSNVLGTKNPIKEIIYQAKLSGVVTLIDGAQGVMHDIVDVQDLDCDFYVFSGHKIYGPSGIGILYGRKSILDLMPPWEGGGSMISTVSLSKGTTYAPVPWIFEAGSPNIGSIIGLGAALKWIVNVGMDVIIDREKELMGYALERLSSIPDIVIYSPSQPVGVIAFNLVAQHAFDVGSFLDHYGIAIRTGHHCAMPLMQYYAVSAMCRASFVIYNNEEEVDRLVHGLMRIRTLLGSRGC
ncbi:cysteine desulfurase SufS [Candidatus Erwinia haradaeae]|uniref:Cysteine desulfurase n=1 Tax=Candidatus Erwinia haradaeae TaxID=1922217 RepID=A0A451DAE2_9GAMM|nr:cysteine desulfurase SufS [Candidatus Erwinia haradaeae]VFP83291.1 Cysteine desulfurase [Candidatus Erwinia haradaeae]